MTLTISGNISISDANLLMKINPVKQETILKVVGCIAEHSSSELAQPERVLIDNLEQTLKEQLSEASPETFRSICKVGFLSGQMKMIDVCRRVASFSHKDSQAIELAQNEAAFTPKPPRVVEQLSESFFPLLRRIGKVAGQAFHIIYLSGQKFVLMTVLPFYWLAMDPLSPVSNPNALEKGPIKILKSVCKPIKLLTEAYYGLFETTEKAHTVALLILAAGIAIYFIHRKFRLGVPEELDRKELFQNISTKVIKEGIIEQVEGRDEEKKLLKSAWQVPAGGKYKIGLLVGPTGVGKTEFVNGLAWESVHDESSFVYKKTIYSINTILLAEQRDPIKYFRQEILPSIEGHEDDVILFFDEGHSAGEKKGKIGPLIEFFKTEILARNIRCLLGTTTEEYQTFIASNIAFVDRGKKITFKELSDRDMILILQKKAARDESRIAEFDPDSYEAIVKVSANDPEYKTRSNPRKTIDLYNEVSGYVSSWKPTKLQEALKKLNQEIPQVNAQCLASSNNDPDWSSSEAGQKAVKDLREKRAAAQALADRIEKQHQQFQAITRNLQLEPVYRAHMYKAVHIVADPANPPAQAKLEYLFIKFVVRPALKAAILEQVEQFKADFSEEEDIPIKINAALIQKQYPSGFSHPEMK